MAHCCTSDKTPSPIVATVVDWPLLHPVELCWDIDIEKERESKNLQLKRGTLIILVLIAVATVFLCEFNRWSIKWHMTKVEKYILITAAITAPSYLLVDQFLIYVLTPKRIERFIDRLFYVPIWLVSVPCLAVVILYETILLFLT